MQFAFEPTSDAAGDQQWMMRVGGNPIQIIVIYAAILMSGGVEIVILQNDRNIEYIYIYKHDLSSKQRAAGRELRILRPLYKAFFKCLQQIHCQQPTCAGE